MIADTSRPQSAGFISFFVRNRVDVALVLLAFALIAPVVAPNNAQPASRIDLTAAIVEHHSVDITRYPKGVDYSLYHGIRSDKAPGQMILATPFYAAARAVGFESAEHKRQKKDLTLWWVTFWSATVPFAILLVMMRRTAVRYAPQAALPATIALGFCTMLAPYAANLYGHVLAAMLAFGAWSWMSKRTASDAALVGIGFMAGVAVFVEYEAAAIAAVLLVYAAVHFRARAWWYCLGTVPGALALGAYQWIAFGAPWHTPYPTYVGNLNGGQPTGLRLPFAHFGELLWADSRSLLFVSPVVAVAIVCAFLTWNHPDHGVRDHARVGLAIFALYVLIVASSKATDVRDIPGPRFILATIPFLVVPLAAAWSRVRIAAIATAMWGSVVMLAATYTELLVGEHESLVHAYRSRIKTHSFLPSLWSIAFGDAGTVLRYVVVALAIWFVVWAARRDPTAPVDNQSAYPTSPAITM